MSPAKRLEMVDWEHPSLSIVRQCALLGASHSSHYYRPMAVPDGRERPAVTGDPLLRVETDEGLAGAAGIRVSRKRVQRPMRAIGLRATYWRPSTSRRLPEHPVYPYLLRNVRITRPNQVWTADITYLPMARGFLCLVAVMDWHSRYVVAWRLSNTLEADF